MLKVNYRNSRARCAIKEAIQTPEQRHQYLLSLLLTLRVNFKPSNASIVEYECVIVTDYYNLANRLAMN